MILKIFPIISPILAHTPVSYFRRCSLSILQETVLHSGRLQRDVVYLCWPSKCGGGGGVAASQPISTDVNITWHGGQINSGDLPPYLTYGYQWCGSGSESGSDPPNARVFGPSGSGSGSFYHLSKKRKKNLDFYCFVTSFWLFTFKKWCKSTFNK
jgi:hypothetical protein